MKFIPKCPTYPIQKYHAVDWAVFCVLAITLYLTDHFAIPHCRTFEWTDPTINQPKRGDTFPSYTITLLIFITPFFYILFVKFAVKPLRSVLGEPMSFYSSREPKKIYEGPLKDFTMNPLVSGETLHQPNRLMLTSEGPIYPWIRAHLWSSLMTLFVVDLLKLYAGRLRPDFLSRLEEAGYTANAGLPDPRTDVHFYCSLMHTIPELREGRLSFPSGHSASYFAVCTVLMLFLLAHLRPFARQGSFVRLLLALSPLSLAAICAVSRTRDHKHHFSDIAVGSGLGAGAGVLAFHAAFRSAGGPLTVYLARSEVDVEYLRRYRASLFGGARSSLGGANYQATAHRPDGVEADDGHTAIVCTTSEPEAYGGPTPAAPGMLVTESELNEDPNAVSWL